jgi:lipopolysaccharide biosynthesis glycosyltransferase
MANNAKNSDAFLMILDSNLKFQSLALILNILETQSSETRIVIFYVNDDDSDLQGYLALVKQTIFVFGFDYKKELVEVKFISTKIADELTKNFVLRSDFPITRTSFLRLFLTKWLPEDIETLLYIDVDILIKSNLQELFEKDFDTPICAELCFPRSLSRGEHLDGDNSPYFNSGVLLINMNEWRKLELEESFIEIGSHRAYLFLDQDILNIRFRNDWTRLGRKYNYFHQYGLGETDLSFSESPSIIHFVGPKPWKEVTQTQFVTEYRRNFNRIRLLDSRLADVAGTAELEIKG